MAMGPRRAALRFRFPARHVVKMAIPVLVARDAAVRGFGVLAATEQFLSLPLPHLEGLVQEEGLAVKSEDAVAEAVETAVSTAKNKIGQRYSSGNSPRKWCQKSKITGVFFPSKGLS